MKSPLLFSLGISVMISIAVLLFWLEGHRDLDEHPFMMAGMLVLFPLVWFFTWLIVNAVVWWLEDSGGERRDDEPAQDR